MALAVANLLVDGAGSWLSLSGWVPKELKPPIGALWFAQAALLGMIAALVPTRPFVGLAWLVSWAAAHGYLMRLIELWLSPNVDRGSNQMLIITCLSAAPVAAIAFGCRSTLRWRIDVQPDRQNLGLAQFSLAAIIEFSAYFAIAFGSFSLLLPRIWQNADSMLIHLAHMLLLGVPMARTVLADPRPTLAGLLGLGVWCLLVSLAVWSADLRLVPFHHLIQMWRSAVVFTAAVCTVLFVNLILLRSLGYRWYGRLLPLR